MPLRQWTLKITEYADKLEAGLKGLQWPEGTLTAQKQWIGRSEGTRLVSVTSITMAIMMGVSHVHTLLCCFLVKDIV